MKVPPWADRSLRWLWVRMKWGLEPRLIYFCLLGPFVLLAAFVSWLGWEPGIRNTGMVLQLVGVATVYLGIRGTRLLFNRPKLTQEFRAWLERFPRFRGRTISVGVIEITEANDTVDGRGMGSAAAHATIDQRIEILERNYASMFNEVGELHAQFKREITQHFQLLASEVSERKESNRKVLGRLDAAIAKPLHLQFAGVIFFALGIFAGTSSIELAPLIERAWGMVK